MPGRFSGFEPAAITLLGQLAKHNDRAWFAPRKERFQRQLFEPMRALVEDADDALLRAGIPLRGDPRRSVFRIYRDVRFSADKTPYRTHLSAYLSYDGERDTPGGIYIRIEPKASLLEAVFHAIERPMLARWRSAMAANPAAFKKVLAALRRRGLEIAGPDDCDDALARMPRGFERFGDAELAPYFRLRSFYAGRGLSDRELGSPALVKAIVTMAKDSRPFFDYGWALV